VQSHLHGRPCAVFPRYDAERIVMRAVTGTPLVEARFPSALAGRVACFVSRLPDSRHAVPLRRWLVPAQVCRRRSSVDVASIALAVFGRSNGSAQKRPTRSNCRRPGFCVRPEWRFAIEHVGGLARDTHLASLFERDERTAKSTSSFWTMRASIFSRTVAHLRVMHLGRLFARRSATRNVNGRRATWPTGR
jgi:hypothetical protein